ncbi:MAG: FAD binding domain-containing protein [Verrucomicrobia subdivision 3 bacterium]|nr:FAD binding domain-containing protein [Limisphaerales bacterium]
MKAFEYSAPKSLKDATALLSSSWGETEILAGGTDLVTSLKQGIAAPKRVVSLRNIRELRGVDNSRQGLRIGAMTTLEEIAQNKQIKEAYPAIVTAISSIGSPQIISVGTIGGDLCQRPRCWYFRNGFGLLGRQGETSLVRTGDNRYHAIFGTDGPALFVSPSSLGPPLIALGATITAVGPDGKKRDIPAGQFFQAPKSESERETALKSNEILTAITIPSAGGRSLANATYEVRHRHGLDWPYVTASVAFQRENGVARKPQLVLGHVAPVPWVSAKAAQALEGGKLDEATAKRCGDLAAEGAKPLSGNAYKIQLVKTAVKRAVLAAAA